MKARGCGFCSPFWQRSNYHMRSLPYSDNILLQKHDKVLAPCGDQRYNGIWVGTNEDESRIIQKWIP